jgi:hypothetical protein
MKTLSGLMHRVHAHYLEMPGLRLKADQVRRLCGIEQNICELVLDALVNERFLCVNRDGTYVRATEGHVLRAQPAKADIRLETRSKNASCRGR